jgi:hypothetical protein
MYFLPSRICYGIIKWYPSLDRSTGGRLICWLIDGGRRWRCWWECSQVKSSNLEQCPALAFFFLSLRCSQQKGLSCLFFFLQDYISNTTTATTTTVISIIFLAIITASAGTATLRGRTGMECKRRRRRRRRRRRAIYILHHIPRPPAAAQGFVCTRMTVWYLNK